MDFSYTIIAIHNLMIFYQCFPLPKQFNFEQ